MVSTLRDKPLTEAFIKRTNKPGIYGDGRGGHGLKIANERRTNGRTTKTFIQALTIIGHGEDGSDFETTRTIGRHGEISLKKARKTARKWAKLARKGIDPRDALKKEKKNQLPTLSDAGEVVLAKEAKATGEHTEKMKQSLIDRFIYPTLGDKRLPKITPLELYDTLSKIHETAPSETMKVARLVSRIFQHYTALNEKFSNPLTPELLAQLPRRTTPDDPFPSLSYHLLPSAFAKIDSKSSPPMRAAIKAVTMTGLRPSAAIGGEWNEITWKHIENDLDWSPEFGWEPVAWDEAAAGSTKTMVWTIPASRMKGKKIAKRPHRIPVSSALLSVFLEMRQHIGKFKGDPKYIFPSPRTTRHVSRVRMAVVMAELNLPSDNPNRHAVAHGFRSTLRNWCADREVPFDLAELALAHTLPKVVRSYLRSDMLAQRARLMHYYGEQIEGRLSLDWTWAEGQPKMIALNATLEKLRADTARQITEANERADREIAAANERFEKQIAELSTQTTEMLPA